MANMAHEYGPNCTTGECSACGTWHCMSHIRPGATSLADLWDCPGPAAIRDLTEHGSVVALNRLDAAPCSCGRTAETGCAKARDREHAAFRGEALTAALSRLLDLDAGKCRLDHNGFCQEHGSGPGCIVAYAREVLDRYGFPTTANGPPLPPPVSAEEARRVEGAAERCRWHRDLGGGESRHCAHPRPCPVHDDAVAPPKETP
jgi:hypothetical protein